MNVPFNDLSRIFSRFGDDLTDALLATFRSGQWINGPRGSAFADAFAAYIGVHHCLPVANGTDALELAMRAVLHVRPQRGREVITVANAGGYAVTACRQIGLTPVFADIDEDSQLINAESVVAALSAETAIIVATHLYGGVVDVLALRNAVDAAGYGGIPIIEDCAQAQGAHLAGRHAGAMGDIAAFSFYPTKNLGALGDAGAVTTSDPDLYETLRQLHQYGWSEKYRVAIAGGRNSRMDEAQASVLTALLPHLDEMNRDRVAILTAYREAGGERLRFLEYRTGTVAHLAVGLCPERQTFRRFMEDRGVATAIHYPILDCDQPGWRNASIDREYAERDRYPARRRKWQQRARKIAEFNFRMRPTRAEESRNKRAFAADKVQRDT